MFYSIRHLTKFRYSAPVSESVTELRMQPRTEANQRCLTFQLSVHPRARVASYRDYLGNSVHHFDVPGHHRQLVIVAEALVDVKPPAELPARLGDNAWERLDEMINQGDYWEMLTPSHFARPGAAFDAFAREIGFDRREAAREQDPLELLLAINGRLYSDLAYVKSSTKVDSPIEDAVLARHGVCQDFAHIMLTLVRGLGIPARYVSGYLFHRSGDNTRSAEGATHAWIEALLPDIGWLGFDPTNNITVSDLHVRTAVGRDYADVPPSRGVYKGNVKSELTVRVRVAPSDAPPPEEETPQSEEWKEVVQEETQESPAAAQQQQQQ